MPTLKEDIEELVSEIIDEHIRVTQGLTHTVNRFLAVIDGQKCEWTITEDDPIYGKVLSLGCDDAKHHPFFLLRLDKYPFCPCCGRKVEVKDGQ